MPKIKKRHRVENGPFYNRGTEFYTNLNLYRACKSNDTNAALRILRGRRFPNSDRYFPEEFTDDLSMTAMDYAVKHKNREVVTAIGCLQTIYYYNYYIYKFLENEDLAFADFLCDEAIKYGHKIDFDHILCTLVAEQCSPVVVRHLISKGANVLTQSFFNRNAVEYAQREHRLYVEHRTNSDQLTKANEILEMILEAARTQMESVINDLFYNDVPESGMLQELTGLAVEYHEF